MKILNTGVRTSVLISPFVFVFYLGFHIVDRKSPMFPFLNQTFCIIFGTALMVIGIVAIYHVLKNVFSKTEKGEKSNFFYLEENQIK